MFPFLRISNAAQSGIEGVDDCGQQTDGRAFSCLRRGSIASEPGNSFPRALENKTAAAEAGY
jgi:hypothetical protein